MQEIELLTAVVDAVDSGLIVLDGRLKVVVWNAWIATASGISQQEAVGRSLEDLFPSVTSPALKSAVTDALGLGSSRVLTHSLQPLLLPLKTRSGRQLIHNVFIRPLGSPPKSQCLVQVVDITAANQREQVLRERQNARYDAVVNSAPDAILTLDARGIIQLANPAAAHQFGYALRDLTGLEAAVLLDDSMAWPELWTNMIGGEFMHRPVEVTARRKDGSISLLEVSAGRWQTEERVFVTAIFRDVNQRRAAEEALRDLNQTLEDRVKERTQELVRAEEQLRQSQKMEAVGQLTGGVAHDFNNLLTIIKSSTDLLRRHELAEERRRRYVDAISHTVDRAAKLTGQLLAFARRQALKPEVFDVRERIDGISDMLRTIVGSRIEISADIDCQPCFVEADISQFETALVNMAVNARDAMEGEGTLTVVVRSLPALPALHGQSGKPAFYMELTVMDTGTGIPPEQLDQIFEPFFTTKEVGRGTGLGLSQVYGFAKQSGGDVAVESELGEGATFKLYLPLVEAPIPVTSDSFGEQAEGSSGRGQRILVVEDNADVGQFSTQLLQDLGYKTTWAANAMEALDLLRESSGRFDAVFSDVVMPGMTGVEFGHEVRRLYPGLPVVLTSGYSHVLASEGPQGFELLHKPYAIEDLSRILRRVTRGRALSDSHPAQ